MVLIDPTADGVIRIVRHQQRQTEAVQDPLCRALPLPMRLGDLDQLACERQVLRRTPKLTAELSPQLQRTVGDVRAPIAKAPQLPLSVRLLLLQGPQVDA